MQIETRESGLNGVNQESSSFTNYVYYSKVKRKQTIVDHISQKRNVTRDIDVVNVLERQFKIDESER